MSKLSYSDRFNNVKKYNADGTYTGIQIASKLNQKNGQDYKLIDSIDIDWNKAWLNSVRTYINTTEELFDVIDRTLDLREFDEVKETLNNIVSTYVTKTQLNEILLNYQKSLYAGSHISIDDNNYINAYGFISEEEADAKYAYNEDFETFKQHIEQNVAFIKAETVVKIYELGTDMIQQQVIKNADKLYDDLEKISDWILSQQRYIPIDYNNIDLEGNTIYYIYDSLENKYKSVNEQFIQQFPNEQYYISADVRDDLSYLVNRINYIDETIGYTYYIEENDSYGYTGLINDIKNVDLKTDILNGTVSSIRLELTNQKNILEITYNYAYDAHVKSDLTYELTTDAISYSSYAYQMAYTSVVTIGNKHSYAYYKELTDEEKELLINDPTSIKTYTILDNGNAIEMVYDPSLDLTFYKYVDEIEASGIYKELDNITEFTYLVKKSSDESLFRLNSQTNGSEFINLILSPNENDGTNKRTLILNIDESDINKLNGIINKYGIITTYSLENSLSYQSSIIDLEGKNKNIDGLLYYDNNGDLKVIK